MDDRKPGKAAPEPSSMAAGWSLAHALDGANRRAKPKASLSRHLVGHRVALPAIASSADVATAAQAPEDAALVARSAQAGEASWAHERVALIGRALDSEAKRLAADPAKAGAVAEHLAPLIEKAFAGAAAEAPGEHARAIVGREREPFETELLSERAVMSVAAKQRAEREARNAALADELAMLKEQPQRWAAAHGRRARAIDDLPLDDKRRNALKGAAARAQANAAAEGLLQQDASWLLEDLDDPDFAGALGLDDAARWRSEAEAAVARRAERIAAESAERTQLAASDMRATLKRFKHRDDGPLPPREIVAASLGSEAAADTALAATLKGRKQRHAEAAVALMAPADETGWIEAAPDKETRTVRELAVATKRASVAGNPGRWLMQHSATLKELAKEATDDPAQLPRLAEHYAALRHQVSGRGANAESANTVPGKDSTRADRSAASLPDTVAADLVDRVLAGETPQARLEVLTKILNGAAGSDGGAFTHADAIDADNRARADAIARQLEALGLPDATAMRWARLADPRMRRSMRLALLGGFAKQIAAEKTILSGEGEEREVVGDDRNGDTLFSTDEQVQTNAPRAPVLSTEEDGHKATEAMLERIEDKAWGIVQSRRQDAPESVAADFLQHYLDGKGQSVWIDPAWLRTFGEVDRGLNVLKQYFSQGLVDPAFSQSPDEQALVARLMNLADGDVTSGDARWDAKLFDDTPTFFDKVASAIETPDAASDMDLWNAIGTANLSGKGAFEFIRRGDSIIVSGIVNIRLGGYDPETKQPAPERYDWEEGTVFMLPGATVVSGDEMIFLEKNGNAQTYDIFSEQEYTVTGEISLEDGKLLLKEPLLWTPTPAVAPQDGSRVYSRS